jgi:uncharacterized protein YbaA (DUF1428 family)
MLSAQLSVIASAAKQSIFQRAKEGGLLRYARNDAAKQRGNPFMPYVDGFIVPVPKKNLDAYVRLSKKCGEVWREYGALDYREWVAEDVKVGKLTSFPRSVKLKPGEVVVFAWITYKSRAQRDRINAKVMKDPRLAEMSQGKAPFDGKRMIYGGFDSLVKA